MSVSDSDGILPSSENQMAPPIAQPACPVAASAPGHVSQPGPDHSNTPDLRGGHARDLRADRAPRAAHAVDSARSPPLPLALPQLGR